MHVGSLSLYHRVGRIEENCQKGYIMLNTGFRLQINSFGTLSLCVCASTLVYMCVCVHVYMCVCVCLCSCMCIMS